MAYSKIERGARQGAFLGENITFLLQKSIIRLKFDTFDVAKPQFSNRGKKRRSVSTLSIPRASDRGVEGLMLKFEVKGG